MLLNRDESCLLVVDVQKKLTPLVLNADAMVARCAWMMRLARELGVPAVVSEHYSKGLGDTVEALQGFVNSATLQHKVHFSCFLEPSFIHYWQSMPQKQVVLVGIETHVCILQTALDSLYAGHAVYVVVDAVSSRHALDHQYALKRMKQAGVQLVTAEMVFFEWVEKAGTQAFKALSQSFLQG